jgi:hypothetical protein
MATRGGARPNSGRKTKDEEKRITDLMKPYSLDAVRCLAEIVINEKSKDTDRISASKLILAYTYGNPKDTIEQKTSITSENINWAKYFDENK